MPHLRVILALLFLLVLDSARAETSPLLRSGRAYLAIPGQFPYHVAVMEEKGNRFLCSGILIRKSYVLTAASCASSDIYVLANLLDLGNQTAATKLNVKESKIHPKFNFTTATSIFAEHNIAVLNLASEVANFNESTIRLPEQDASLDMNAANTLTAYFLNFGRKGYLKFFTEYVEGQASCKAVTYESRHAFIHDTQFCAKNPERTIWALKSDYGSPLVASQGSGVSVVTGIVASYSDYDTLEDLAVFTQVSRYSDWIKSSTSSATGQLRYAGSLALVVTLLLRLVLGEGATLG